MYTVGLTLVVAVLHLLMLLPQFAIGHLIISKLELESLRYLVFLAHFHLDPNNSYRVYLALEFPPTH